MPEATEDATFLIATSWQALSRAKEADESTSLCNCTVILVFAAFYIEANLTHIIDEMGEIGEMKEFVKLRYPGLYPKLGWFYNKYIGNCKAASKDDLYDDGFRHELFSRYSGFEEIHGFRNNVAHGVIDRSLANLKDAKRLRANAKDIVADLFEVAEGKGSKISRAVTYAMAISSDLDPDEA